LIRTGSPSSRFLVLRQNFLAEWIGLLRKVGILVGDDRRRLIDTWTDFRSSIGPRIRSSWRRSTSLGRDPSAPCPRNAQRSTALRNFGLKVKFKCNLEFSWKLN
jgi:hypothetical protein